MYVTTDVLELHVHALHTLYVTTIIILTGMYLQAATYKSNNYYTSLVLFYLSIFGVESNCYTQSGTIREHVETNLAHARRLGDVVFYDWHQLCGTLGAQQATTMAAKTK